MSRLEPDRALRALPEVEAPPSQIRRAIRNHEDPGFSIGRFKLEAIVLLLLLGTVAVVQFQDLFTSSRISLRPETLGASATYLYGDDNMRGHSTAAPYGKRPLSWTCELRAGYQYPFCGYGITFDTMLRNDGLNLANYQHVTIKFRFEGPAPTLRFILKHRDRSLPVGADPTPGEITLPVKQGLQTVRIDLDELGTPLWWAQQNHLPTMTGALPRNHVVAIEMSPGGGARIGHYRYAVESITIEGKHFSQAQFYLAVLVFWVVLLTGFLVWRVSGIRRLFEGRHQRQLRESRELQFARAVAERSSAAKSAFLANMSHELRTPLNAILGYAQLLEQEGLADRHATAARTIRQSGTHLLTLITDILDLSKIEAGRLELEPAPFDLPACVAGVADMMRIRASEKAIDFICTIDPQVPRQIVGDEKRLRQVLINLLGNAIKFTSNGEVALLVSRIASPTASGGAVSTLRIEIRDTGLGMTEDELPHIFEAFEQVGPAERRAGGTGLGLSITRQIVALMGGGINVESTAGRGSRFWFDIVVARADAQAVLLTADLPALPAPSRDMAAQAAALPDLIPPAADKLEVLMKLAQTGNMRLIRNFADELAAGDPAHRPFADKLKTLAASYQSKAILDLVSRSASQRQAA